MPANRTVPGLLVFGKRLATQTDCILPVWGVLWALGVMVGHMWVGLGGATWEEVPGKPRLGPQEFTSKAGG